MQHDPADQAVNSRYRESTALEYQQYAKGLAEAVEAEQAATREARQWQEAVDETDDSCTRRYFEGLVKLCTLKAFHHNLNAQFCQRAGQEPGDAPTSPSGEGNARTLSGQPATREKTTPEDTLTEKARERTKTEYSAQNVKVEALLMLAGRYQELGLPDIALTYSDHAQLETATIRGFQAVIEAYDSKLRDSGFRKVAREESASFETSYRSLECAKRYLEDYGSGNTRYRAHTLQVLECEGTLQRLEVKFPDRPRTATEEHELRATRDQRDTCIRLAEKEALGAALSYQNFLSEVQSAKNAYDAIARALTGSPFELTHSCGESTVQEPEASRAPQDPPRHPEDSGQSIREARAPDSSKEFEKPLPQVSQLDDNRPPGSERRMNRLAVGVVVCQALKVMDREL